MLSFKQYYNLLFESFKDAARIWQDQSDSQQYIDNFKLLRSRKQLSGNESDIGYWIKKDYNEFKQFVDTKLQELDKKTPLKKKAKDKDSPIVFENDKVYVHHIKTKAASCKLGSDSDWCVTKQGQNYWERYTDEDITFYFIIKKTPVGDNHDKLAVNVYPKYLSKNRPDSDEDYYINGDNILQMWDIRDNNISDEFPSVIKGLDIPSDIFKEIGDTTPFVMVGNKKFKYTMEGSTRVYKDIVINSMNLKKIPDFGNNKEYVVTGNFYCFNNQLTTLEGAPNSVGGSFGCYNNKLTSLEGAPKSVGGNFNCYYNQLTSLEGAPKSVGGNFYCNDNKLTSLEGAPKSVGGNFYCFNNQLTTLEGAPNSVGGSFACYNNKLTSLEGAPKSVGNSFYCNDNKKKFTKEEVREVSDVKLSIFV